MDRQMDGTAPETRCPQCGLAIKVTNQPLVTCPVCGAKLPVVPAGKTGTPERKGPISLEQALFKSPRIKESWAPRETFSTSMLTFFAVMVVYSLVLYSLGRTDPEGNLIPDPVLYFSINVAGLLVGVIPVVYVFLNKMNLKKLAFKQANQKEWLRIIGLGIAFGFGLYAAQFLAEATNRAIGLPLGDTNQVELDYRLILWVPAAAAQVLGEFFYRGTLLNGLLQWLQKRVPPLSPSTLKFRAWILSVLLGTLFDFALFFNPMTIIPSLFMHALAGALFIYTGSVQSGMIAQGMYVLLVILFV